MESSWKAHDLYCKLYSDFNLDNMKDDWSFMNTENDYITPEFKTKYMGLVVDNTETIRKIYTATFPDREIIQEIFDRGETNVLLFSHHAMEYIASEEGFPFYNIPLSYLSEMKRRQISFYMLHSPLDNYGEYSTSVSLAKALGLQIVEPFCKYDENTKVGVICKTTLSTVNNFQELISKTVNHEVKLYEYGSSTIKDGVVAIAAGGGSYPFVSTEVAQKGINCYLTGFTKPLPHFEPTLEFHNIAQSHHINVLGATHYSTEKFACIAMVKYFRQLGLQSEFLEGRYYLEDL